MGNKLPELLVYIVVALIGVAFAATLVKRINSPTLEVIGEDYECRIIADTDTQLILECDHKETDAN